MIEISNGRIKMSDIARIAGVSVITVSRALRGSPLVTAETKAKIIATARKHGYILNTNARALRAGESRTIAAVLDVEAETGQIVGPFQIELLGGMLNKFSEVGYSIVLTCADLLESRVVENSQGLIVLGQGRSGRTLEACRKFGLPMVLWGEAYNEMDVAVGCNNWESGIKVAEHFISLGRKYPVFVGDISHREVEARWRGFSEVFRSMTEPKLIGIQGFGFDVGFDAVKNLSRVDCIFAANDQLAMGVIRGLIDSGKSVPGDVSVVGFDDLCHASTFVPPLSSVRQMPSKAGELIAEKMLALLEGQEVRSEVIPGKLIIRAT